MKNPFRSGVPVEDAPISAAEIAQWSATVDTMQAADKAAGITNKGTVNARRAVAAADRRRGRKS